jgi:hypothetical protein
MILFQVLDYASRVAHFDDGKSQKIYDKTLQTTQDFFIDELLVGLFRHVESLRSEFSRRPADGGMLLFQTPKGK